MSNPNKTFSRKDVAEMLGVDESTVRRWIAKGQLRAYRYGPRLVRIHDEDLRDFRRQIAPGTYSMVNDEH